MSNRGPRWQDELGPMLRLAIPLAMAELGWMAMGVVDTIMAGRLGAAALGAGSLGSMLFYPVAVSATGLLLGMDTLVAQAFGARDRQDCRQSLVNGVWLALALGAPFAAVILALVPLVRAAGVAPGVMMLLAPFMKVLVWSLPPLLLYSAFRRYLQAVDVVKPVTFALVSANVINAVGNWVLMFGHWGAPRMGLEGSGWSTTIARFYMAAVLLAAIVWHDRRALLGVRWRPDARRMRSLLALGWPAATQILAEGAGFGLVTVFAARLDEVSLAAHSLAVNVVSTTFMVPLGISSAAAVRVGQAAGAGDRDAVAVRGWTALAISSVFMGAAGLVLWIAPEPLVRVYTRDGAVVGLGAVLLRIAAFFQLFDGLQITATGALRGLGNTRATMLTHLVGYWLIGLPMSYVLCFVLGWGAPGIWIGLSAALILIGLALVVTWWRVAPNGCASAPAGVT